MPEECPIWLQMKLERDPLPKKTPSENLKLDTEYFAASYPMSQDPPSLQSTGSGDLIIVRLLRTGSVGD